MRRDGGQHSSSLVCKKHGMKAERQGVSRSSQCRASSQRPALELIRKVNARIAFYCRGAIARRGRWREGRGNKDEGGEDLYHRRACSVQKWPRTDGGGPYHARASPLTPSRVPFYRVAGCGFCCSACRRLVASIDRNVYIFCHLVTSVTRTSAIVYSSGSAGIVHSPVGCLAIFYLRALNARCRF